MPAGRRRANTWSATACAPRDRHSCRSRVRSLRTMSRSDSPRGTSIPRTSWPSCFILPAAAAGCLDCSRGGGAREQWESCVARMAGGGAARAAPPACAEAGARIGVWRGFPGAAVAAGAAPAAGAAWRSASASWPAGSHSRLHQKSEHSTAHQNTTQLIRAEQQDEDDDMAMATQGLRSHPAAAVGKA